MFIGYSPLSKRKKIYLLFMLFALSICIFGAYIFLMGHIIQPAGSMAALAGRVEQVLTAYIVKNAGDFPASEADLIHQRFLRINPDNNRYEHRPFAIDPSFGDKEYWSESRNFGSLKLRYGVRVEDITLISGELYDRSTGMKIMLIDAPYREYFEDKYRSISARLYKLMVKEKAKAGGTEDSITGE